MSNYWLIPMNYQTCDLMHLLEEYNKPDKTILWQAPPKHIDEESANTGIPNGSIAKDLVAGGYVYFYVTNLPTANKEALSRILLRGKIVENSVAVMPISSVWPDATGKEKINTFKIEKLVTLKKELIENNDFLRLESKPLTINDKKEIHYHINPFENIEFIYPQGWTKWPNTVKGNFPLGPSLDQYFEGNEGFDLLIAHFKKRTCYFCNKLFHGNSITECEHRTFIGRNGLNYYEYHHFILQKLAKNNPNLKPIVESPSNGLCLCSNCHNRFHYGTIEEIKMMIDTVLEDSSIIDEKAKQTIEKTIESIRTGKEDISHWLLNEYLSR